MKNKSSLGKKLTGVFVGGTLLVVLCFWGGIAETNNKGQYQIKQAAVTGNMSARMNPGLYAQMFGTIDTWNKAETFFFTKDKDVTDDVNDDNSMQVRFNDGSKCDISGTLRIEMPTSPSDAIALVTEKSYRSYADIEAKLVKPTVRNVLRSTANLMSAKESYDTRRADFIQMAQDQIQNGLYQTEDKEIKVKDMVSGEMISRIVKVVKTDGETGPPLYFKNPLEGTGIVLANFEVKVFDYEDKVNTQIAKQQEALMAVQTAKAKAAEAEQNKLTIEAQGKANVAQAQYQEKQIAAKQVVQAERDKEMALIVANKKLEQSRIAKDEALVKANQIKEVAELAKDAAEFTKQEQILLGQGEAERKRLVMAADGALEKKLTAIVRMNSDSANALARRAVPTTYIAGSNGNGGSTSYDDEMVRQLQLMNVANIKALNLKLDLPTVSK